jgi:hypothetical protein
LWDAMCDQWQQGIRDNSDISGAQKRARCLMLCSDVLTHAHRLYPGPNHTATLSQLRQQILATCAGVVSPLPTELFNAMMKRAVDARKTAPKLPGGKWRGITDECEGIAAAMLPYSVHPDVITFNTLMHACVDWRSRCCCFLPR